ncbi:MAG: hypothetical protein Q6373_008260 [Candidatus Sigynarchaeota archaeon]
MIKERAVDEKEAAYLHARIAEIIEMIGPGQPGSEGEKRRGRYFHDQF